MTVNNELETTLNFINKLIDVEFGNLWIGYGHGLIQTFSEEGRVYQQFSQ